MDRGRLETNLQRLLDTVHGELAKQPGTAGPFPTARAQQVANGLFLANSSPRKVFEAICVSEQILCQFQVTATTGKQFPPTCAEAVLETAGFVFLYAGSFRYPETSCGFLFRPALEDNHRDTGCASPFDSGGLLRHFVYAGSGHPPSFHRQHEIPLPEHRNLLALTLDLCFGDPLDLVRLRSAHGLPPSPFGIAGGDLRRYTHEVRIPDFVPVRSEHLEAVFVGGNVTDIPALEDLAEWCGQHGVSFERFDAPGDGDYEELRKRATGYIERKLY